MVADETQFGHDRLSHLLADRLLQVPRFQRSYSWEQANVVEFLDDLYTARQRHADYFMGTVVFADGADDAHRQLIVDGQQRLTTTALLLIALRDLLAEYGKEQQSRHIDETYLRGYDLDSEEMVERLLLNPYDQPAYHNLLSSSSEALDPRSPLVIAYQACVEHLRAMAPASKEYRRLVDVAQQLDTRVQVLVAVASDLSEAYVIFETLNGRGADLTTADLLKNYLFSQAKQNIGLVEQEWIQIQSSFDNSEDLVKFIRYEYASRHGRITTRKLYRALHDDIGTGATNVKNYIRQLRSACEVYSALRDPDHARWNELDFDVRDPLIAFRRFQFESSTPLLLAAFARLDNRAASKLMVKIAGWSVRAQFAGRIGNSLAEEAFGEAAKSLSAGQSTTQPEVRARLAKLVPSDIEFKQALRQYGNVSIARAKYLLAMLERAARIKESQTVDGLPDWSSKGVTIEHIAAQSTGALPFINQLGNLTLLEKALNRRLEDKPFTDKCGTYKQSVFTLTRRVAERESWDEGGVKQRVDELAELACLAWEG